VLPYVVIVGFVDTLLSFEWFMLMPFCVKSCFKDNCNSYVLCIG